MYSNSHKNRKSTTVKNGKRLRRKKERLGEELLVKDDERTKLSGLINAEPTVARAKSETGTETGSGVKTSLSKAKEGGFKLPDSTRTFMQSKFNYDFSDVKVHTDSKAVHLNRSLKAQAFTYGKDIFFNEGRYNPGTNTGKKLLTHELTHVVQQNSGAIQKYGDATDQCITEEYAKSLSNEELEMEIELVTKRLNEGYVSEEESTDLEDNLEILIGEQNYRNSAPPPKNVAGKIDSKKIIRVAWTFDDGPTPLTKAMIDTLGSKITGTTWFIMYDKLLQSPGLTENLGMLKTIQDKGGEIGIHSFNPSSDMSHAFWFPSSNPAHHSYASIDEAMTALTAFHKILTDAELIIKFVRLPGGLYSELLKYLSDLKVPDPGTVAREIIAGKKFEGKAAQVVTDFEKMKTTLSSLGLHLWGGSSKASEIQNMSWEAETSGVESRADTTTYHVSPERAKNPKAAADRAGVFERTVDMVTEDKPRSLVILAHDTTSNDIKEVGIDNTKMNEYALSKGVRIEYCTMSQLYEKVRGTAP